MKHSKLPTLKVYHLISFNIHIYLWNNHHNLDIEHFCLPNLLPLPTDLSLPAPAAKSLQSCPTLCDPIDGSPPGSPVPGILQARTLEWVAISFSNAWKWKMKVKTLSCVRLLATPWLQPTRLLRPWDFPGKSTGVHCHCLLQFLNESITIKKLSGIYNTNRAYIILRF